VQEGDMPARKLKDLLDSHNVKYVTTTHSTAYTAQEVASLAHVRGAEFAKSVIVTIDGVMVMAVVPASYQVDLPLLRTAAKGKQITLSTETEFRDKFPECETGAMPPFGELYGMAVFVDENLAKEKEIVFNAGTHHELIRLSYEDFAKLVKPAVAKFSTRADAAVRL
jgi:Ala-tRNA(Pro) deacylase